MRMISSTVYLREDQLGDLRKIQQRTGKPMAAMIRKAVDVVIGDEQTQIEAIEIGIAAIENKFNQRRPRAMKARKRDQP